MPGTPINRSALRGRSQPATVIPVYNVYEVRSTIENSIFGRSLSRGSRNELKEVRYKQGLLYLSTYNIGDESYESPKTPSWDGDDCAHWPAVTGEANIQSCNRTTA